ncbi:MAG: winged helix-turn-helix domain-containing protein [Saccharofermentanales bacterium]
MLLKDLNKYVNESLVNLLWNQWTQLGVLGQTNQGNNRIIDPEALLLFSMNHARYDARLFDEIYDWTLKNERWISLQRLKGLANQFENKEFSRSIVALARCVIETQNNARWKSLAEYTIEAKTDAEPFFLTFDGAPIPVTNKIDDNFKSAGWLRSTISARGNSMQVPFEAPNNLILLLRSLFGLTPRAEIISFLFVNKRTSASDLVSGTGYSKPSIYDALSDLLKGGYIQQQTIGSRSFYSLDSIRWEHFINISSQNLRWIDWQRVFVALDKLTIFLNQIKSSDLSNYMLKSKMLTVSHALNSGFVSSGLDNPFSFSFTLENVMTEFPDRVQRLMNELLKNG